MQVFLIAAITVDGFIAKESNESPFNWTSQADKKFFRERTKTAGVVIMGSKTFATIDPKYRPLKDRLNIIYTRQNKKDFCQQYQLDESHRGLLKITRQDPKDLVEKLVTEGREEVAICGGASIYTQFMQAGVVDTLYLIVEPVLFGSGVKLFNDKLGEDRLGKTGLVDKLKLQKIEKLGKEGTVLLEYGKM